MHSPASRSLLLASLAGGLCFAAPASATIVYSQDFEAEAPSGVTRIGGYGGSYDTDSFNGTRVGKLDVDGVGYPRETAFLLDSGVTLDAANDYTVTFDLSKANGGNNQGNPAPQDVVISLFAGAPTVTDTNPSVDVTANGATLLASTTYEGATDGTGLATTLSAPSVGGTLFITIDVNNAGNPQTAGFDSGYGQIEIDNVVVDATPNAVPEPGSLVLGACGALLLGLRRRR